MKLRLALTLILLVSPVVALAQSSNFGESPFSSRLTPDAGPTLGAKALEKDLTYFLSPLLMDTDGLRLGKVSSGLVYSGFRVPFRLGLSYSYLKPDESGHLDQFGASLAATLVRGNVWGLNALTAYTETKGGSTKIQAGLSSEVKVGGQRSPFSLGGDALWVQRRRAGHEIEDVVGVVKAALEFEKFSLGGDYTFENDLDEEDDYSFEVSLPIWRMLVAVGVGKHDTIYSYFFKKF